MGKDKDKGMLSLWAKTRRDLPSVAVDPSLPPSLPPCLSVPLFTMIVWYSGEAVNGSSITDWGIPATTPAATAVTTSASGRRIERGEPTLKKAQGRANGSTWRGG
jgi:hypothetical protein